MIFRNKVVRQEVIVQVVGFWLAIFPAKNVIKLSDKKNEAN